MKKGSILASLLVWLFLVTTPALADPGGRSATLVANFDLDGASISAVVIHSADAITDGGSYTIDAQPDTPRPLLVTVVDADSSVSACTLTVVGTSADGQVRTATTLLDGGSGTKTLSPAYNWASVTSSSTGTCTGETGADTVALGTTSTIPILYFEAWGDKKLSTQGGTIARDPFTWRTDAPPQKVKTTASSASITSNTASSGALASISLYDLLLFNISGEMFERGVITDTDANNVVVDSAINIAAGYFFRFKKHFAGPDDEDAWVPFQANLGLTFSFYIDQMDATSIDFYVQCRQAGTANRPVFMWTKNYTAATTTVGGDTVTIRNVNLDACRAGGRVNTDDGADTTTHLEKVSITVKEGD